MPKPGHMNPLLVGVLLALGAIAVLTTMDAIAKLILEGDLHLMQILALRSGFIALVLYGYHHARAQTHLLKRHRARAQWVRGAVGSLAPIAFFGALQFLPLTDATVVAYTSVFVITILSALVLGERVGPWRWSAVVIGYCGVFIAMQPTGDGSWVGYALVMLGSGAYSALAISGKWLGDTETSISLVYTYNLCVGLVTMLWLPWVWQNMDVQEMLMVTLFAILAGAGQVMLTMAYKQLDGSLVAPLEYTSLAWAVMLDALIWQYSPALRVLVGAAVIIAASLFVLHRERVRAA